MIDLNHLCEVSLKNATQRMNNGANIDTETRKMLKHCATEVVEAADAWAEYDFVRTVECEDDDSETSIVWQEEKKSHFASELADIICCVLIIAGKEGIDIEDAVTKCIEKNRLRAEGKGDKK